MKIISKLRDKFASQHNPPPHQPTNPPFSLRHWQILLPHRWYSTFPRRNQKIKMLKSRKTLAQTQRPSFGQQWGAGAGAGAWHRGGGGDVTAALPAPVTNFTTTRWHLIGVTVRVCVCVHVCVCASAPPPSPLALPPPPPFAILTVPTPLWSFLSRIC